MKKIFLALIALIVAVSFVAGGATDTFAQQKKTKIENLPLKLKKNIRRSLMN